jgi:Ca2+-binding RTX toxin-like protein
MPHACRLRNGWLSRRLQIEPLEERRLLAIDTISFTDGKLLIEGSPSNDTARVSIAGTTLTATLVNSGKTTQQTYSASSVTKIIFRGYAGNDTFTNQTSIRTDAYGSDGNDTLTGGSGIDYLFGEGGNDVLNGSFGDDILQGGVGNDQLFGHDGHDNLLASDGDDTLSGGNGNDKLSGDIGQDRLDGNAGLDKLMGGDGNDLLNGGTENDSLYGDGGNDTLSGNEGNDSLFGLAGNDTLFGGTGNDQLQGGLGADHLYGDAGLDMLMGGDGNDILNGGTENDNLFGNGGDDALSGAAGNDSLHGGGGRDYLSGNDGHDTLAGDDGDDRALGGNGQDNLMGGNGNDVLSGGAGNDTVYGDAGNDAVVGDADADRVNGGLGRDVVIGGLGIDTLNGLDADDILIGSTTTYDTNAMALRAILNRWSNSTWAYDTRLAQLQDRTFSYFLQSQETVHDDFAADMVMGNLGNDWFFLTCGEDLSEHEEVETSEYLATVDTLADMSTTEKVNSKLPHPTNPTLRKEHLALMDLVKDSSITDRAIASGSWTNPAVWASGKVPVAGADVVISEEVTITINGNIAPKMHTIRVDGTLAFNPNVNTVLRVDTLIVTHHGTFQMGTAAAPIAGNVTATLLIADNGAIDRVWDPYAFSRGFLSHGVVSIYGQEKTSYLPLSIAPQTGDTQLQLSSVPTNWKVGDQIVITGVGNGISLHEERTIVGINGAKVQIAPLAAEHVPPESQLQIHVANLTRNAIFESENPSLATRGHVMFMHNRNVEVHYLQLNHLGRTNKLSMANDAVVDANNKLVAGTGTNVRGRYALHFHRNGVTNDGKPAHVVGSVVNENPGWGFVNHSSFVEFTNNVAFNVDGASFASETGDEIGSFDHNIAIHAVGSGENIQSRELQQDFGHQGDGFWMQGGGVTVTNNVAAGQGGHGFIYFTLGIKQPGLGITMYPTANLANPAIAKGAEFIDVGEAPLKEFSNNVAYGNLIGAGVWFHKRLDTHDARTFISDLTLWNNNIGLNLLYVNEATVRNAYIVRGTNDAILAGKGVSVNDVTRSIRYENPHITGFYQGMLMPFRGDNVVHGGTFNNFINVTIPIAQAPNRTVLFEGNLVLDKLPESILQGRKQTMIEMLYSAEPRKESIEHLFYADAVTLNFGAYLNRRLYFAAQAASFIPLASAGAFVPSSYVGKTNQQLLAAYGKAVGGALAPATAIFVTGFKGLMD